MSSPVRANPHRSAPLTTHTGVPAAAKPVAAKAAASPSPRRDVDTLELTPPRTTKPPVPAGVREALTTSWRDWSVTDTDVSLVHRSLEALSMPEYQTALGELEKGGLLDSYVDAMDATQRAAFLDQASRKGALGSIAGEKVKGPFDPPSSPRLYVQSGTLPPALRRAVHEGNLDAAGGYNRAYRAYVDRYAEGVMQQPSREAIKALGEPARFSGVSEPGLESTHPDYREFTSDWVSVARMSPDNLAAWGAIGDRMADLTGEVRAGSFWFQAEAEVVRKDGAMTRGQGVDLTVRTYGAVELTAKKSFGVEGGGEAAKAGAKLELASTLRLQKGVQNRSTNEATLSGYAEGGKEGGPTGSLEVSSNGDVELGMKVAGPLGSYAKANRGDAKFEGGLTAKAELRKDVEVEVKVGAGFKGITADEVARAIDPKSRGFFGE
ncbi:MAG: hypothetical protein JNK82_23150 [Myxococcaceae bacterium]|nr:hypothetical protein [Myxococcaceae bacterium]